MRTTITLDDQLLAKLKKRAGESGTSVSGLIAQAVRLLMKAPPGARHKDAFNLVTFGAGGHFSRRNIDSTSSLLEGDDMDRFAR
jgi:Arc/MetJ family transcription regulator